eukprot:scaffold99909_cov69-Phaeocystis_antarctica.AAC.8
MTTRACGYAEASLSSTSAGPSGASPSGAALSPSDAPPTMLAMPGDSSGCAGTHAEAMPAPG